MDNPNEYTIALIKPDAVKHGHIGRILTYIEDADIDIAGMIMVEFDKEGAELFYQVHEGKPFFNDLTDFLSSGKSIILALRSSNVIQRWRALMTDIRDEFGTSVMHNCVHGSDSVESAESELYYIENNIDGRFNS